MSKFCLIMTATIQPIDGIYGLKVVQSDLRKEQYIRSLRYAINNYDIKKIIFCENSHCVDEDIYSLKEDAEKKGKTLEIISFNSNSHLVLEKGKGYGEGEIIKYAKDNSKIIEKDDYIIKLTGRLIVKNLNIIMRRINHQDFLINRLSIKEKKADTRFYIIKQNIYDKFVGDVYQNIDDRNNLTMETLVYKNIVKNSIKTASFCCYPQIIGISGSTGQEYSVHMFKYLIKCILNILGVYRIK